MTSTVKQETSEQYLNEGKALAAEGNWKEAIPCYQKAIELQPELHEAYLELGDAWRHQNEFDRALYFYLKLTQLKPGSGKVYSRFERLLEYSNLSSTQLEKIYQISAEEITKYPNHTQIRTVVIYSLSALDRVEEASQFCQEITYRNNKRTKPEFVEKYWQDGKGEKPNFIVIGFMKCGTTSLYDYILQHPQVLPASQKEIMFFNNEKLFEMGVDWYRSNFPKIPDGSGYLTGEASTLYVQSSKVARRLRDSFPDTKLIVLLRNPVDRAISHYHFNRKLGYKTESLEKALTSEIQYLQNVKDIDQEIDGKFGYLIASSLYIYFLEKWMSIFPREQFLILRAEDLAADTSGTLDRVFDFLSLPNYKVSELSRKNTGSYANIDKELHEKISHFFEPYNQKLQEHTGSRFS
ncbi:MAG: sulfotransferase domain-containing protein [Geitlerinemataceae cyanobacterium]